MRGIWFWTVMGCGSPAETGDTADTSETGDTADTNDTADTDVPDTDLPDPNFSFFVSSTGNGANAGNLGGLAGADQKCADLAAAVGSDLEWHAYLSTSDVNARDRIGDGPWYNAEGALIAVDVTELHADGIPAELVIDENGETIDLVNAHDIITGASQSGGLNELGATCLDYTSNSASDYTAVGHANGGGVGDGTNSGNVPESWNAAHLGACDQVGAQATAGRAHIYCFGY